MGVSDRFQHLFETLGQSKIWTTTFLFLLVILCVICIILSVYQSQAVDRTYGDFNFAEDVCDVLLFEYVSPFSLTFTFGYFSFGEFYYCPWRPRNTVFRIFTLTAIFALCVIQLIMIHKFELFTTKNVYLWSLSYWFQWFGFIFMFIAFVLDTDGLNSGWKACRSEFEGMFQDDSGFPIGVDQCYMVPWIYMVCFDILISCGTYFIYRVTKEYTIDAEKEYDYNDTKKRAPSTSKLEYNVSNDGKKRTRSTSKLDRETRRNSRKERQKRRASSTSRIGRDRDRDGKNTRKDRQKKRTRSTSKRDTSTK